MWSVEALGEVLATHSFADTIFNLFLSRAVSGVDDDPNLVHMEAQDLNGGKQVTVIGASELPCSVVSLSWPLVHWCSLRGQPWAPTSLCADVL